MAILGAPANLECNSRKISRLNKTKSSSSSNSSSSSTSSSTNSSYRPMTRHKAKKESEDANGFYGKVLIAASKAKSPPSGAELQKLHNLHKLLVSIWNWCGLSG